ncbi:poly(ADP-ribose) glycohydrolase 1 [Phtheirospermum japonicum]|uniref:Poly(ADP-ribose) glycohydrolase 1 n=1 Tax=Phtheirospermum japonicum TaxID=374723 RepID=A0A830B358_9LAMI|nr:poly(ADP-ribose) glycohydrolase 1 [Phtheirospermum japonicum]
MEEFLSYLRPLNKCSASSKAEAILTSIVQGRVRWSLDLIHVICDLRDARYLSNCLSGSALRGFDFFFWLEHYNENANMDIHGYGVTVKTSLCILESQQTGAVCLSQELIAALLACSLFCLFLVENRPVKNLPTINFDQL